MTVSNTKDGYPFRALLCLDALDNFIRVFQGFQDFDRALDFGDSFFDSICVYHGSVFTRIYHHLVVLHTIGFLQFLANRNIMCCQDKVHVRESRQVAQESIGRFGSLRRVGSRIKFVENTEVSVAFVRGFVQDNIDDFFASTRFGLE